MRTLTCVLCLAAMATAGRGAGPALAPDRLLVLGRGAPAASGLVPADPVLTALMAGTFAPPRAGDTIASPGGRSRAWEEITPDKDGQFEHASLRGGSAYWGVNEARGRIAILEASGHSTVYVNGEPRPGDVYETGYVRLPVHLRAGRNDILFRVGRGRLRARLVPPAAPLTLDAADATLPDAAAGKPLNAWGALVLVNATERPQADLVMVSRVGKGPAAVTPLPVVPPLSVRKVGFRLDAPGLPAGTARAWLRLARQGAPGTALARLSVPLRVRRPGETYKATFVSRIDGSVQYYAVNPRQAPNAGGPGALLFSLHGASVEASGQADAYAGKTWAALVAPTNRRPYGYDWEDWGRLDALEVLDIARTTLRPDPSRLYLIGHSMGGHGTWQLGALYPGTFAAIAPSAGWISASTYAGGAAPPATGVGGILRRAGLIGDTLAFANNYRSEGVYVLHGDADDNVPVTEARHMKEVLSGLAADFQYHEQPGQGHWWDLNDEPGADCVDWPPMMDYLAAHRLPRPDEVRDVDFTTGNPGVSAACRWVTVLQQERSQEASRVQMRCDPLKRRFVGTTTNVRRLALGTAPLMGAGPVTLAIDGQTLTLPAPRGTAPITLKKTDGTWAPSSTPPATEKNPARYGPFRAAFDHRMVFVTGTAGTPEENAWSAAAARYDAETWWYRGNGAVDVVPDTAFDAAKDRDRGVVLYGNADTNRAWTALLANSPVQVRRSGVRVGEREIPGGDLACLFLRPRPGSAIACVAAVSGTGLPGARLASMLPYLQPMTGLPDVLVAAPAGICAAGFFGPDWTIETGDFAWE